MAVLATDDFARANNSDLGANWTPLTGEFRWSIKSNAASVADDVSSDSAERYSGIAWPDDQYAQGKITITGTGGGNRGVGVGLRMSAVARTYYRVVGDHAAASNISLSKIVAGVFTNIWQRTQAFTDADVFRGEAQGTTLRVYLSGAQIGADATDGSVTSGDAGISYSSTETSASLDDWEGGGFTAKFLLNRGLRPAPFRPGLARFSQVKKDRHNGPAYRTVCRRAA